MAQGQTRLAYILTALARTQRVTLVPQREANGATLTESELKALRPSLHPLDIAIAQDLCGGSVYGQLTDTQLARLLPLLVQRVTIMGGARLKMLDLALTPRVRLQPSLGRGLRLTLGLYADGAGWLDIDDGRLVAGTQAFFLRGNEAYPVTSPAPWQLAAWSREPVTELLGERLSPSGRDSLVRELAGAGVPADDLGLLAVRRGPPEHFILRLLPPDMSVPIDTPHVAATVEVVYPEGRTILDGQRPVSPYLVLSETDQPVEENAALTERDIVAEEDARRLLKRLGFRYERSNNAFVAQDEAALAILDPTVRLLPAEWIIDRTANSPKFHRDLTLTTKVKMLEDRGLLDLQVDVQTLSDDESVAALVSMKDLLTWLQSGKRYMRLADGSYAAPSAKFRQGLSILGDLGADGDRALISPLCIGLLRAMGDHAALAAADEATRAWLEELSGNQHPPSVEPPSDLSATLRDYQRRGLDWLMMLHRHRLTGVLADDMGLGKTLQTLALLLKVRQMEGSKPSLVVAPTSVITVWRDEAMRFAPNLNVVLWYGPPEARHSVDVSQADLVVTSYGVLRRDAERFADIAFRYVILDEAQSAKNAASHNAHAIRMLKSERRLALSGTPIENRPEELWSVFDFLAPGFLGSLRLFRKRYALPIGRGETEPLNLLRLRMQPLLLRRLKTEVAKELPDKIESIVRCEMDTEQRVLYDHVAGELRESVARKVEQVGIARAHLDILAALTRLRQICCDPALLPAPAGTKVPPSAKLALFEELMREALDSSRCVVVFSQFVEMQARLIEVIKSLGVDPLWLHGGTRHRDKVVANFQDPQGPPVIVVSLRAGGTGLTLTRADTVMHYDPWWNPAVERQATDRTHRLGQVNTVTVYKLVCARSIEERVVQLAERKEALARELLGSEGGAAAKHISKDDVLALLS